MTAEPMKVADKGVARALLEQAEEDWQAEAEDVAAAYVERLKDAAGQNEAVAAVLDLHGAHIADGIPEDGLCCDSCTEGPYYDTEAAAWPCKTVLAVANALPASGEPPKRTRYPVFEDFYEQPDVTITLAHHSNIDGEHLPPRTKVTMPLSRAQRYRYRMTAESWAAVERLSNA